MFKRELNAKLVLSVIATGIMSFSGVVVETAMNVTFPTLMEEFSIGTSTVQWMTTSYLLILAIIMPMSSYLNRRLKTKSIFTVAMIFYISGILCGFAAPTFMLLLLGRILEGIGTGLALPLMFNIITEQAPLKNMGVMMGIGMLVTAVAPAVGPSAGGWIAEHLGWRMIFAGLLPFLIVAFVLGISSIQQSHETEIISFDVFGWLLLTVSFIALIFVIDESSAFGLLSIPVLLAMVILWPHLRSLCVTKTPLNARSNLINLQRSPSLTLRYLARRALCSHSLLLLLCNLLFLVSHIFCLTSPS